MFTNVFDVEMRCLFFDEEIQFDYKEHIWRANFDRLIAYDAYQVAVHNRWLFDRTILYTNFTLKYLRHDAKWDRFVKSDMLQKKTQSLLKVTPSVRDFHKWRLAKRMLIE
jgi:hypothetical protein